MNWIADSEQPRLNQADGQIEEPRLGSVNHRYLVHEDRDASMHRGSSPDRMPYLEGSLMSTGLAIHRHQIVVWERQWNAGLRQ